MNMLKGLVLALVLAAPRAAAADAVLPRVDVPAAVDGDLSDPVWSEALHIDRFYEVAPGDNVEPPVRTEAWLAYDARALYVAFRAADPHPERIRAPYLARDRVLADQDFLQIDIDAQNDGKATTLFRVNARGVQTDGVFTESAGASDLAPDFDFRSAAKITAEGWQAELRIPLSSLRYPKTDPQTWRVTLMRIYPRERRYDIRSAPVPRGSQCWTCGALRIGGITGLPPAGGMTLVPYTTSRAIDAPDAAARELRTELGGDLKWLPAAGLSVDATFRPDFSQIEADAAQLSVNTRFALFYPEKRPFFMEGADLLSSPIPAIHTRTITSPLWGARLTARPGNHALTLIVADDRGGGSVIVPGPAFSSLAKQPDDQLSAIGRYRYSRGRSSGGLLLTLRRGDSASNLVAGPDVLWWPRPSDQLRAQVLFSSTSEEGRRMEDRAALVSWTRSLRHFSSSVTLRDLGRDFRADSGFVPQAGVRGLFARASWTAYPKRWLTRVQPELWADRIVERDGGGLVSQSVVPRVHMEGWRATAAILELHPDEKSRALDGTIHSQNYVSAVARFLLSRRLPYLRVTARHGQELDVERARVGRGTALTLLAALQPLDPLQVELSGESHRLSHDEGRLFDATTVRAMTTWTFSTRASVRLIAERQSIDWNPALAPRRKAREGFVDASLLLAYRLDWQSSLYVGYGDARRLETTGVLGPPRRELFLKISYALRPQEMMKGRMEG